MPFPYVRLIVGKRHCRVRYIIPAQPELILLKYPKSAVNIRSPDRSLVSAQELMVDSW